MSRSRWKRGVRRCATMRSSRSATFARSGAAPPARRRAKVRGATATAGVGGVRLRENIAQEHDDLADDEFGDRARVGTVGFGDRLIVDHVAIGLGVADADQIARRAVVVPEDAGADVELDGAGNLVREKSAPEA